MHVNVGIWDKLARLVVFLIFIGCVTWVFLWYLPLIQKNQAYRKRLLAIESEIVEQERLARQIRARMDALRNDPKAVERLARESLGLVRTNEMVVHFESPKL